MRCAECGIARRDTTTRQVIWRRLKLFQRDLKGIWVDPEGFQHDLKGIWVDPKGFQPRPEGPLVLLEGFQLGLEELWVYMEGFEQGLERHQREPTRRRKMTQGCWRLTDWHLDG